MGKTTFTVPETNLPVENEDDGPRSRIVVSGKALKGHLAHGRSLVLRIPLAGLDVETHPDDVDRQPVHSIVRIAEQDAHEHVGRCDVAGARYVLLNRDGTLWAPDAQDPKEEAPNPKEETPDPKEESPDPKEEGFPFFGYRAMATQAEDQVLSGGGVTTADLAAADPIETALLQRQVDSLPKVNKYDLIRRALQDNPRALALFETLVSGRQP